MERSTRPPTSRWWGITCCIGHAPGRAARSADASLGAAHERTAGASMQNPLDDRDEERPGQSQPSCGACCSSAMNAFCTPPPVSVTCSEDPIGVLEAQVLDAC